MAKKLNQRIDLPILETNIKTGLTDEQVKERKDKGYSNNIKVKDSKTIPEIIFKNVFTFFNTVLISVAIVFLIFIIILKSHGRQDVINTYFGFSKFLFVFPAILNITTGTIQEIHSKKIIDSLKIVTSATSKVIRNEKEQDVSCSEVVRDDIIIMQAGEQAACDMILLEGTLQVDESMLTGESDHIKKMPGDTVYSGSAVIVGYAKLRVAEVGDYTYVSKLQSKVKSLSNHTSELMDSIVGILKVLTMILAVVVITIMITMAIKINLYGEMGELWGKNGQWKTLSINDLETWARIMVTAGSFAIGIIPSGLVLTTSLTLITSIVKLSRQNTLIQELYSLENLSRVDVICLDKTGTLTDGTMKLVEIKRYEHLEIIEENIQNLLGSMDTRNQTAEALYKKFGAAEKVEIKEFIPFSSEKKCSGLVYPNGDTLLMGAPEYLLDKDDNRLKFVTEKAMEGKRVIALKLNEQLLCFFVIEDQIRSTAPATLKFFKENNVTVKVISGDNPITVAKIAKDCGIENAHKAISLEGMPLEEIPNIAEEYTVFARVSPEQKAALVDALQNKGHKVAMTGDGVNDILALRKANASITFAKATDAAKSCSDVILLDNDFSHLKEVVGQGRRVINNVQRTSILFLMKSFAIAILAFALIAFKKGQMWYTIENAYLLEATVIGVGGILLSLEGTKQPLRGSFFKNIMYKALVSGLLTNLAIIVPILCWTIPEYYGLNQTIVDANGVTKVIGYLIESEDQVRALITILLTLSGMVTMLIMSLPLNKFRVFAFVSVWFAITGLAFLFPTSYIGGQPTTSAMFMFDHTTQTFLDCQFMRELFHPWRSPIIQSLTSSAWTKYYAIIIFLFIWQAIPIYFIVMRLINRQLKISYKREEEARIAKKLELDNKELPNQIQA